MSKDNLPEMCFAFMPSRAQGEQVVAIKRGEMGCYKTTYDVADPEKAKQLVEHLNTTKLQITAAQAEAMLVGSMFGWHLPGAQVASYEAKKEPLVTVTAMYNGDAIFTKIRAGQELTDGLKWEDENEFEVKVGSIKDLRHVVMDSNKDLIDVAFAEESVDRLHALSELNPEIPPMPGLDADGKLTEELKAWLSNPKVFHYLKRVEEAMPDLLFAANAFIELAPNQQESLEVCSRLTGCELTTEVSEDEKNQSRDAALKIAEERGFFNGICSPANGYSYCGKILGLTDHHVVQSLGRHAIIYAKSQLSPVPAVGQEVTVKVHNGRGRVTVMEKQAEREVSR